MWLYLPILSHGITSKTSKSITSMPSIGLFNPITLLVVSWKNYHTNVLVDEFASEFTLKVFDKMLLWPFYLCVASPTESIENLLLGGYWRGCQQIKWGSFMNNTSTSDTSRHRNLQKEWWPILRTCWRCPIGLLGFSGDEQVWPPQRDYVVPNKSRVWMTKKAC